MSKTYTALGDILDLWHGGHLTVRPEAEGAWNAAVDAGEEAMAEYENEEGPVGGTIEASIFELKDIAEDAATIPSWEIAQTCAGAAIHMEQLHAVALRLAGSEEKLNAVLAGLASGQGSPQ